MKDPLRDNAIKLALAKIDADLGQSLAAQRTLLEELIGEHSPPLSYTHRKTKQNTPYTADKLREHLMTLVKGSNGAREDLKGPDIFKFGSDVLTSEYCQSIGYTKASTAPPAISQADEALAGDSAQSSSPITGQEAKGTKRSIDKTDGSPEAPDQKRHRSEQTSSGNHETKSGADASKAPMSSGEQSITATVSTTKPAPANTDAWNSQEKESQVDQKFQALKAQYDELRSQFDELKSQNEVVHAERGAWESKYKDLLKTGTESTEWSGDLARVKEAVAVQTAHELKAWTEKEPDEMKRRVEAGLPRLIQDCEDQITRPVDTDAVWPRPLGDLENAGGILGNYAQLFPSHMRRLAGSFYQITGFCLQHSEAFSLAKATIVPGPSSLLEKIYEHLFGSETDKSWQIEAKASVGRGLRGTEFLRAILGAAIHEMVFTKPLPWATASDWLEKLGPVAPYLTAALRRKGCLKLKMDDVLWLALRTQIDNATFQNRVVMPRAKLLADTLQLALRPQLELLGITGSKEVSDQTFWNETSAELTEMFMNALILKGSLDASPFEYEFCWIPAGKEFVYTEMERPIGSPPGEKAIIAAATTPKLRIRCPSDYAYPGSVCCKAQVAFRPLGPL